MSAESWVGQTIAGKYRVERVLGRGGMGVVLLARHMRLDEDVAIKILLPSMMEVTGMVSRFLREARAASKIKSAHVARVTDVDVLEGGVPYMVMEYLEGVDLAALRRREGPMEIGEAVRCVLEASDAIAEAHALGIVHRDLKPANLFLARARNGRTQVKVLDFGISKVDAPDEQDATKTGTMMGSPKYMSPEQMLSMHDVDARSDIWSLGAILYDLVAGRPPFAAENMPAVCALVLQGRPKPLREHRPDVPEALAAVVLRCLARERTDRFSSVPELAAALAPFGPPGLGDRVAAGPLPSRLSMASIPSSPSLSLPALSPSPAGADEPPTVMHGPVMRAATVTGPPESLRGPTISTWNAAVRPPSKRNNRTAIVLFAAAGALLLAVLLVRVQQRSAAENVVVVEPLVASPSLSVDAPLQSAAAPFQSAAPAVQVEPAAPSVLPAEPSADPSALPSPPPSGKHPLDKPPAVRSPKPPAGSPDPFGGRRR